VTGAHLGDGRPARVDELGEGGVERTEALGTLGMLARRVLGGEIEVGDDLGQDAPSYVPPRRGAPRRLRLDRDLVRWLESA
jgi:hypothetical protein